MQTKIAYFGDSWCRPRHLAPVNTFVDVVSQYWGQELKTVHVGRAGGTDMAQMLRDIEHQWLKEPWDLAIVVHEPFKGEDASRRAIYLAQQQRLIDWFRQRPQVPACHWRDRDSVSADFGTINTDTRWLEYIKFNDSYRYAVSYQHSDNAMNQAANWLIAEHIIELITACRNSKKQ